jgi:hypothetical protein
LYLTYEINWIQDQEKNVSKTWKRSVWTNNVGSNFCASVVFWTFWHFCIIIDFAIGVKNCSLLLSDYKKIIHYWYKSNNFQKQDENNEDGFFFTFCSWNLLPLLKNILFSWWFKFRRDFRNMCQAINKPELPRHKTKTIDSIHNLVLGLKSHSEICSIVVESVKNE